MKLKKIILLMVIFSMVGVASAWADDAYDSYKAKKIKIVVNQDDSFSGLTVAGKEKSTRMVPLQDISDTLQALIQTDDGSVININKPNVHMSLFEVKEVKGDTKLSPFGDVNQGGKYSFVIFSQIDNLLVDIQSLKIVIEDPYEMEVKEITKDVRESDDHFWYSTDAISLEFKNSGKYTVNFYMKPSGGQYTLVSQKTIYSIKKTSTIKPSFTFGM